MDLDLDEKQIESIETILKKELIGLNPHTAILVDTAGNVIASLNNSETGCDIYSLAALSAANFGAMEAMADIIGEQGFAFMLNKGEKKNILFCKIAGSLLLITIFNRSVSPELYQLMPASAIDKINFLISSTFNE